MEPIEHKPLFGPPTRRPPRRLRRWATYPAAAFAAVVLLVTAANLPLLAGWAWPKWDAADQNCAWQTLVADHARAGTLLRWDPWTDAGAPDCIEPQIGAFSPYNVGIGLVCGGGTPGFALYWLATILIAAIGMVLFARRLGTPVWGWIVVATAYVFGGFFIGHTQHAAWIQTMAWLPWIMWRVDVAVCERRLWPAAQAGTIWGLAALGGYPPLIMFHGLLAAWWAIWPGGGAAIDAKRGNHGVSRSVGLHIGRAVAVLGLMLAIGLIVLAPTYIAFAVESRGFTDRSGAIPRDIAIHSNPFPPSAVITATSPYLGTMRAREAGALWNGKGVGNATDVSMVSLYIGSAAAWLALIALLRGWRDRWRWWLVGGVVLAGMVAMSQHLPVRGWLYDLLPPFRYFRHAAMIRGHVIFLVCALAAMGARQWTMRAAGGKRLRLECMAAAGLGVAALVALFAGAGASGLALPRSVVLHACIVWLALPLLMLPLARRPRLRWKRIATGIALLALADAAFVAYIADTTFAYDERSQQRWQVLDAARDTRLDVQAIGLPRLAVARRWTNDHLLPRQPVFLAYLTITNERHVRWATDPSLHKLAIGPVPNAWFAPAAGRLPPDDDAFDRFLRSVDPDAGLPLAVHADDDAPATVAFDQAPPATRLALRTLRYAPNELAF